ncbi:hypothetical protein KQX54_005261, partial [Cotesia glomerata]
MEHVSDDVNLDFIRQLLLHLQQTSFRLSASRGYSRDIKVQINEKDKERIGAKRPNRQL